MNTHHTLLKGTSIGLLVAVAFAGLTLTSGAARAQDYPNKPVRLIVPFPPGGNTDVAAREIAKGLADLLHQQFVVENKAGAGGSIGATAVAKSAPDGYSLLLGSSALTITPAVYSKIPYQVSDFDPVGLAMVTSLVLVASNESGLKTVDDLLARAKAQPGKLTYASAGIGSGSHLAGELFSQTVNITALHVPFKGSGPATVAVMGGEVDYTFTSQAGAVAGYEGRKLTALAITGKAPSPLFPGVPTIEGAGVKGFEAGDWIGVLAPAGTPPGIVKDLNAAITTWLKRPDTAARLSKAGFEGRGSTPEQFKMLIADELAKWGRTARTAQVKVE